MFSIACKRLIRMPRFTKALALESMAGERDPLSVLTPREFEVFSLLAEGQTAEQIAEALYVSAKTIANHATQIKQKLGIATAVELHRVALRYGRSRRVRASAFLLALFTVSWIVSVAVLHHPAGFLGLPFRD